MDSKKEPLIWHTLIDNCVKIVQENLSFPVTSGSIQYKGCISTILASLIQEELYELKKFMPNPVQQGILERLGKTEGALDAFYSSLAGELHREASFNLNFGKGITTSGLTTTYFNSLQVKSMSILFRSNLPMDQEFTSPTYNMLSGTKIKRQKAFISMFSCELLKHATMNEQLILIQADSSNKHISTQLAIKRYGFPGFDLTDSYKHYIAKLINVTVYYQLPPQLISQLCSEAQQKSPLLFDGINRLISEKISQKDVNTLTSLNTFFYEIKGNIEKNVNGQIENRLSGFNKN